MNRYSGIVSLTADRAKIVFYVVVVCFICCIFLLCGSFWNRYCEGILIESGGTLRRSSLLVILNLVIGVPIFAMAAPLSTYFDLSLLGDAYVVGQQNKLNNGQLHGRFKLLHEAESYQTYIDLGAGGLAGEKAESYFILPQAYFSAKVNQGTQITVGRRVMNWSSMDDYWQLGDVQPLFRWDAARPEIQGLSGIMVELKPASFLQVDLFGSYLYVPTQGPSFSNVDGKLTSGNPWFSRPVDVLDLSGQPYDLIYSVKTPSVSDVVFQPSWGTSVMMKSPNEEYMIRAGYFVKPRNDLVLPFAGTLNLNSQTGDIVVHPRVAQHKLTTLDMGYKGSEWGMTLSSIFENNVHFDVNDSNWIYPQYSDQYKVAAMFNFHLTPFHSLELGGIRTFKNSVSVQGLGTGNSVDIYSFRNQYDNAADVRLSSVFLPRSHGFLFRTRLRYAYDYKVETSLVSADINYNPFSYLTWFVRMDLFGGKKGLSGAYNNLLVNYLDNDRFQTGVKYVF